MNLLQRIKKIYHKLIIVKKIAWFIVNFVSMMPPFKHMRNMMEKLGQRAKGIHEKIVRFGRQKIPLAFLFQVEAQMQIVFLLVVVAIIYLYFKYFNRKSSPKDQKQQQKSKISRQLDELSQKTIEPPKRKIRQQKQEIDSCYEQLHNGLKQKPANQDRVFLAILERYQSMRYENEEQEADHDRMSTNNKITQDNSTEEGNFKTSLRRIPTSPTNKKEADELNRSSVL